jgi:Cof subfamily protein (haloacid dehalogenase superfamily)
LIKLIASDMDGTLVNDNGVISDKALTLIHSLKEKNIIFAAASGRLYSQLCRDFNKVNNQMILIAHNGALIKYSNNGHTIYSNHLNANNIKHILELDRDNGEEVFLAGESDAFLVKPSETLTSAFDLFGVQYVILKNFNEMNTPVYKISYYISKGVKPETLNYLKSNLDESLEFVVSGDKWIDIMNKGTSKGAAIKTLQEKFSIDKKNTMVFGDYYNDLSMFETADFSYAMENAPEDVKKHANFIADNNNDNGVYNVIYKYASSL